MCPINYYPVLCKFSEDGKIDSNPGLNEIPNRNTLPKFYLNVMHEAENKGFIAVLKGNQEKGWDKVELVARALFLEVVIM